MRVHHCFIRPVARLAARRTGRGVRVAVIDSGVHAAHPHVQGVAGGIGVDARGAAHDDYVDRLGHGTAVAAVHPREGAGRRDLCGQGVRSRAAHDRRRAGRRRCDWARAHEARVVNLSLGTANPAHEDCARRRSARGACDRACVVVAAAPQDGTRWLPGGFPASMAVSST